MRYSTHPAFREASLQHATPGEFKVHSSRTVEGLVLQLNVRYRHKHGDVGTCIAVRVGVGGGLPHTGPEEPELQGSQKEIQSNSAQTRRGANYAHMQWPWKSW